MMNWDWWNHHELWNQGLWSCLNEKCMFDSQNIWILVIKMWNNLRKTSKRLWGTQTAENVLIQWLYSSSEVPYKLVNINQSYRWEPNDSLSGWELPCIVWNLKVYYHDIKVLPLVCVFNQVNRVHTFPSYLFRILYNVTLPSVPGSSKWSVCFRFPHQSPVCVSLLPPHVPCATCP